MQDESYLSFSCNSLEANWYNSHGIILAESPNSGSEASAIEWVHTAIVTVITINEGRQLGVGKHLEILGM